MDILSIAERKKRLRTKILANQEPFKQRGFDLGDGDFAVVREPSVEERAAIMKSASKVDASTSSVEFDVAKQQIAAVVFCTFAAEPVMEDDPDAPAGPDGKPAQRVKMERVTVYNALGKPILEDAVAADGRTPLDANGKPVQREATVLSPVVKSDFTAEGRLFNLVDLEQLQSKPVSGLMNRFIPVSQRFLNVTEEDARKST